MRSQRPRPLGPQMQPPESLIWTDGRATEAAVQQEAEQESRRRRAAERGPGETEIMQQILLAIGGRPDVRLWRQNVGAAKTAGGRFIKFGFPGQADLSGLLQGGRRLEIEVKAKLGRQSPEQRTFGEVVTRFGGLYILARSVEEAVAAIELAKADGAAARGAGGSIWTP